ncbi:RNA-binding protein [Methylophaga sp. 41_12_T18]|nr:RNA-binding protein [Methylophaga sp. 41_12_T18]
MTQNITIVKLEKSPTELYKILKFEGLASSGAEAKIFIADGQVTVNDAIELQKRKKIVAGDRIIFADHTLDIIT